jgi:hypothetical protein
MWDMKNFFRPLDILGVIAVISLTVSAIGLEDCLLAWLLGMTMHAIGMDFLTRWRNRPRNA